MFPYLFPLASPSLPPITKLLIICNFIESLEIRFASPSIFFIFFKIALLSPYHFHKKFDICFCISLKG